MGRVYLYDIKDTETGERFLNLPTEDASKIACVSPTRFSAWASCRAKAAGKDGAFAGQWYKDRWKVSRRWVRPSLSLENDYDEITRRWEDAVRPFRELQKRMDARLWAEGK